MSPAAKLKMLLSPRRLFFRVLLVAFLAEMVVHFFLFRVERLVPAGFPQELLDSAALSLMLAPFLWWWIVRPLGSAAMRERMLAAGVIDTSVDAIITIDDRGRITTFNPAAERLFGYAKDEAIGENVKMLMPPAEREQHEEHLGQYLRTGEKKVIGLGREVIAQRKDGVTFPIYLSVGEAREGGRATFTGIIHDLTDRKRAEANILNEQLFSESIVNSLPGIFYLFDQDGRFLRWNQNFAQITGYSAEEIATLSPIDLFTGQEKEYIAQRIQSVFTSGASDAEAHLVSKSGQRTPYYFTGVRIDSNNQSCVIGMGLNITERKQLEEQLRQSQKLEAIGQLAGGVAHDFNNLLTAINGYSALALQRIGENHPLTGYLEEIKKAGDRAANLTRQLLAFGRKQILQPVKINLNDLVTDMNKMLRRLIGEDIDLTAKLDPALKRIMADPGQIEQVLVNLVVNARDAMPQGGNLTITTTGVELDKGYASEHVGVSPGNYVMLAVSDTGTGMNADTQARIFDPFFTTKEQGRGTGLGLSTVYGIVKQSGGNIWVYSEPGHGTTFKVYLPQLAAAPQKTEVAVVETSVPRGSETILLVEDEDVVRGLARQILESAGYHVLEASRGEEAIRLGIEHPQEIHLLLSDVVMPGASGKEVADRLLARRPEMKVLFMSGYTDETIVHHGVLDSGVKFIQKPFSFAALCRKVRGVLDSN